jgi:hypothetical protein
VTPKRVANRTPDERVAAIVALRRLRMAAAEIAETPAMPLSTVSGFLTRNRVGRLGLLGLEQPIRYERTRPGELVHIDINRLGRIEGGAGKRWPDGLRQCYNRTVTDAAGKRRNTVGWEHLHMAVDDHSRLAYAEVLPDGGDRHIRSPRRGDTLHFPAACPRSARSAGRSRGSAITGVTRWWRRSGASTPTSSASASSWAARPSARTSARAA